MNAVTIKAGYPNVSDQCGNCRRITGYKGMVYVILALLLSAATTGCATMGVRTEGASGPVAWKATDLRVVQRRIDGAPRWLYAFTLVLRETQGKGITFTRFKKYFGAFDAEGSSESKGRWELRPHGELRLPFSLYISGETEPDYPPQSPYWNIILSGKDDQDQPVRVNIDIYLPQKPPARQPTLISRPSEVEPLKKPTIIPISIVQNIIRVPVTLEGKERATFILDTGASRTILTPDMARQLGISPTEEAPRETFTVLGGRKVEVPIVKLSSIEVGDAILNNFNVGVYIIHPEASLIDGLIGGDFLGYFKVTLDHAASRLRLEPRDVQMLGSEEAVKDYTKAEEIDYDGIFIRYANGVVKDTKTGLEWVAGPDRDTNWDEARDWVRNLDIGGGGWRMPTVDELGTLYKKGAGTRNMTPLLRTSGWFVWSMETKGSSAWSFAFATGSRYWDPRGSSYHGRAFAVRSRKDR